MPNVNERDPLQVQGWKPDILTQLFEQVKGARREIGEHAVRVEQMDARLETAIKELKTSVEEKYVTQEEFKPIKLIAYGIVSVFMLAVLTAIAALVVVGGAVRKG